jgi:nuclear cap-binding protein subunit 2
MSYFKQCGPLKSVIMGLNKVNKKPCGFCFVEYWTRSNAELAYDCLNKTKIDGRIIRVDWDIGFTKGR